jgi:hypothetical protein
MMYLFSMSLPKKHIVTENFALKHKMVKRKFSNLK